MHWLDLPGRGTAPSKRRRIGRVLLNRYITDRGACSVWCAGNNVCRFEVVYRFQLPRVLCGRECVQVYVIKYREVKSLRNACRWKDSRVCLNISAHTHTHLRTSIRACMHRQIAKSAYLPTYLPTSLPPSLPPCLPTYLPTYLPTC